MSRKGKHRVCIGEVQVNNTEIGCSGIIIPMGYNRSEEYIPENPVSSANLAMKEEDNPYDKPINRRDYSNYL